MYPNSCQRPASSCVWAPDTVSPKDRKSECEMPPESFNSCLPRVWSPGLQMAPEPADLQITRQTCQQCEALQSPCRSPGESGGTRYLWARCFQPCQHKSQSTFMTRASFWKGDVATRVAENIPVAGEGAPTTTSDLLDVGRFACSFHSFLPYSLKREETGRK